MESIPDTAGATEEPVAHVDAREARVVVLSSAIGTMVEFYDFQLYGLAAVLVLCPSASA